MTTTEYKELKKAIAMVAQAIITLHGNGISYGLTKKLENIIADLQDEPAAEPPAPGVKFYSASWDTDDVEVKDGVE